MSDSAEDSDETSSPEDGPSIANGMIEFSLKPIQKQLVCNLCSGYFRDPYTITKCLHTFCRSCLCLSVSYNQNTCPSCNIYLGQDIFKFALPDRSLQDLIDKVLFPQVADEDEMQEHAFYRQRGIRIKPEYETEDTSSDEDDERESRRFRPDDEILFHLVPASEDLPSLDLPYLKTEGSIRIGQLKKYLQMKLFSGDLKFQFVISCNGATLGNELSVNFVLRTVWVDPSRALTLKYQYAEDFTRREDSAEEMRSLSSHGYV